MYSDHTYLDICKKCLEDCRNYLDEIKNVEVDENFNKKYMECIDASYVCIKKMSKSNMHSDEYAELCAAFSALINEMSLQMLERKVLA